jgi:hypothetical protein
MPLFQRTTDTSALAGAAVTAAKIPTHAIKLSFFISGPLRKMPDVPALKI